MLYIRRYEPADCDAVWALHVSALRSVGAHAGRGPWDDDLAAIESVYLQDQGEFLVGVLSGRVVAMGAVKRTSAQRAELKRMRVEPSLQRQGIGRAMLDALEERARDLGYRTLHLDTTIQQAAARRLYDKSGYREVGRGEWQGTDEIWEVIWYEKDLAPGGGLMIESDSTTALNVRVWGEGNERVVLVHGSISSDQGAVFGEQQALADRYTLLVPDRRGYGSSPAMEKPDFEMDVQDIITLLGGGAHLVGFSYGGVLALLVAARTPHLVRSLTLIEPPAFGVARGNPSVEELIERMAYLWAPDRDLTPEQFLAGFEQALGEPEQGPVQLSPESRRSVAQTMNEPPPWEAEIDLDAVAAAPCSKLVVSGQWIPSVEAVANVLTERLHAERLYIAGAGHAVHRAAPEQFNARLVALIEASQVLNTAERDRGHHRDDG